jgi:hypothetical protein
MAGIKALGVRQLRHPEEISLVRHDQGGPQPRATAHAGVGIGKVSVLDLNLPAIDEDSVASDEAGVVRGTLRSCYFFGAARRPMLTREATTSIPLGVASEHRAPWVAANISCRPRLG